MSAAEQNSDFETTTIETSLPLLTKVAVVLVEPTHPGNIGSVARAMKTMGLSRLILVNPKKYPHYEATKLAAGAESVLLNAEVVMTADEAIRDCTMVLGTSVREREVAWPTFSPRETAKQVHEHVSESEHQVAILFGRESSGLTNAEMDLCQSQIRIPANDDYSSLNLASAVQIIAYELRIELLQLVYDKGQSNSNVSHKNERQVAATKAQKDGHIQHLQKTLESLDFIKAKSPTVLMRKLTRLYSKAMLTVEEIQILRGILSAMQSQLGSGRSGYRESE